MKYMKNRKKLYLIIFIFVALATIAFLNLRNRASENKISEPLPTSAVSAIETDFPIDYMESNKDQVQVVVPRVYELLNIVESITESGLQGKYNLNYNSDYYKEVIIHFKPYKDHPVVAEYEKVRNEYSYSTLRRVFTYEFEYNKIVKGEIYKHKESDKAKAFIKLLTDFAQKSNFNDFYDRHQDYYLQKIKQFKNYTDLKKIWQWLEKNYPDRYDSYKVVLSPLVFGSHNTTTYVDKEDQFHEIIMFVSPVELFTRHNYENEALIYSLTERMVFTEIDHNYVNVVTDREENMRKILEVFGDLDKWNRQNGYGRSDITFNEYMTWATACLYVYDYYPKEVYDQFIKYTTDTMRARGFVKFEEFYNELLELYKTKEEPIYKLYPDILKKAEEI